MFTGDEDQSVSLDTASALNKNYRTANPGVNTILGHYLSRKTLTDILAQPNAVGIRVYYALTATGEKEITYVGVDQYENDLTSGYIGDRTYKSPPHSGNSNLLNS